MNGVCLVTDKLCFIPIPKCASISIGWAMCETWPQTKPDNFLSNPKVLDRCVVTVLRDPVARFISTYNYGGWWKESVLKETPQQVLDMLESGELTDEHFSHQASVLMDVKPNIVGRVDRMDLFSRQVGLVIPKRNVQQHDLFEQHRSKVLIRNIKSYYKKDYRLLEKYFGNYRSSED